MSNTKLRSTLGILLGLLLFAPNLHATDNIVAAFNTTLLGKQLFLKNFSAAKEQKFTWHDDHLEETSTTDVHALIAFVPRKITGDNTAVIMHGKCFIAMLDSQTQRPVLSTYPQEISLQITFQQTPSAATEQVVENFLFFSDAETASKAVPPAWKTLVPFSAQSLSGKNALLVETPDGWKQVEHDDPNLQMPVSLDRDGHPAKKRPDPTPAVPFSKWVALHRGALAMLIDTSGKIRDMWILSPTVDMEVTYSFATNTYKYARFEPTQWQHQPVRSIVPLITEVKGFVPPPAPAAPF
jgi:hypothetical protein